MSLLVSLFFTLLVIGISNDITASIDSINAIIITFNDIINTTIDNRNINDISNDIINNTNVTIIFIIV